MNGINKHNLKHISELQDSDCEIVIGIEFSKNNRISFDLVSYCDDTNRVVTYEGDTSTSTHFIDSESLKELLNK